MQHGFIIFFLTATFDQMVIEMRRCITVIRDFKEITTATSTTAVGSKEAKKRRSAHASN